MLRELSVQNLAIIEDVLVELERGFCVWTGETGAGKSLLLDALGLLTGQRSSSDLIRAGADEVRISGRFDVSSPALRAAVEAILDSPLEEEHITVLRRVAKIGRSFAYINERPVALATLRRLGPALVDIHGQHENQSLLLPGRQLELLDAFGKLGETRSAFRKQAATVRALRRQFRDIAQQRQQRLRELSLIRFERDELTNAQLSQGELAELTRERDRLRNIQDLQDFAHQTCDTLNDADGSIIEQLGKLTRSAETWKELDADLGDVGQRMKNVADELQDVAQTVRNLQEKWHADPARLESVENRIQELRRLESKYNQTIEELLHYLSSLDEKEKSLAGQEEDLTKLEGQLTEAFAELIRIGDRLSGQRAKVADRFAKKVKRELADLGMADATLEAHLERREIDVNKSLEQDFSDDGFDALEIYLSANPGEAARPLRKVASGGELSRTMLALKTVLSDHDTVGTLVFDEIDANVGGRLGDVLGAKLAKLAKSHQVICVTHLPQVACFAKHQWSIRKDRQSKRTFTKITRLSEDERIDELTSMLRGSSKQESTKREAASMLKAAKKLRESAGK